MPQKGVNGLCYRNLDLQSTQKNCFNPKIKGLKQLFLVVWRSRKVDLSKPRRGISALVVCVPLLHKAYRSPEDGSGTRQPRRPKSRALIGPIIYQYYFEVCLRYMVFMAIPGIWDHIIGKYYRDFYSRS